MKNKNFIRFPVCVTLIQKVEEENAEHANRRLYLVRGANKKNCLNSDSR